MAALLAAGFQSYWRVGRVVPGGVFLVLALAWASTIWWLSSSSGGSGETSAYYGYLQNGGHVVLFGALTKFVVGAWRTGIVDPLRRVQAWAVVGIVAVYALIDEWHQSMVPGRSCSLLDVGTDVSAAAMVVFGARAALHRDPLDARLFQVGLGACFVFPLLATLSD